MSIIIKLLLCLLISCLFVFNISIAEPSSETYVVSCNSQDYAISTADGYSRIEYKYSSIYGKPGEPELPLIVKKYYVPEIYKVVRIEVKGVISTPIPGDYMVYPIQESRDIDENNSLMNAYNPAYLSKDPVPNIPILYLGSGFYRGHQVVNIGVMPFTYIPSDKQLYFNNEIEFEFILESSQGSIPDIKRIDDATMNNLRNMVENPGDITIQSSRGRQRLAAASLDSIPCLIITNTSMISVFQEYAWWKTRKGIRTEVLPTVAINDPLYYGQGDSLWHAIRRCINDYCYNKFTEWVILGGDVDIIPPLYIKSNGEWIITDQYFSAIDTMYDWNADDDSLVGEPYFYGDSVDYEPDVYVGRIPCSNYTEADAALNKIISYERDNSVVGYQTNALLLSSNLYCGGDGYRLNQQLEEYLPALFDTTYMNQEDSAVVLNAMSSGQGLITFYGHSQGSFNFITLYSETCPSCRHYLSYNYINTKNCHGQYPVFFDFTCHNAKLTEDNVVGREFLLSDSAGGVGFIGSTCHEWSHSYSGFQQQMFNNIFNNGEAHMGKVLAEAKSTMQPVYSGQDSYSRYSYFSYIYLGDPQMEMWTDVPLKLYFDPSWWEDTVDIDEELIVVHIMDSCYHNIEGAKVCLTKGEYGTYMIAYTNENGFAWFTNPSFASTGPAYIVASKKNCFTLEDTIYVGSGGGGGCPMLYAYNNGDYVFINSIMAKSEDSYYSSSNNLEGYPLYSVPLLDNNTLKLRIREDEREKSTIDMLGVNYINYPINSRVAYTNKNEFKLLTGDSLLPSEAIGADGESILERVAACDGNIYECKGPGYCILTYRPKGLSKIMIGDEIGGGIEPPPGGGKGAPKYAASYGETASCNKVVVSVIDGNGQWQTLDEQYSRICDVAIFSDLSGEYEKGEIRVKLEWMDEISIDCLPFYFFADGQIEQIPLNAINVSHNDLGNIESDVSTPNGREVTLMPGQYIDLQFGPIPYAEGYRTAVAFYSVGRYGKLSDELAGTDGIIFDQNYPNPFNPATSFSFYLPANYQVSLTVYNVLGQKVTNLIDKMLPAGNHEVVWNGTDGNGRLVSSGIYFAKFTAGEFTKTRKMTVIK